MAGPHENLEHAEHAQHAAHGGGENNKKIALIISVLALFLAFSETFGKSAQTAGLNLQIEASNLWNFMQAKTIRRTFTIVQGEAAADRSRDHDGRDPQGRAHEANRQWTKTAARYQSEPEAGGGKGEGTRELMRRALEKEKERDLQFNKYHNFEFASAAFQIGIVLASAAVITSMIGLAYAAIGVGLLGAVLTGTGIFVPELLHNILHWIEGLFAGGGHH